VPGARIAARGWGYRYPGRPQALAGVSFDVRPGELVVLAGASGSGKSTLLGALAGTLPVGGSTGSLDVEATAPAGSLPVGLVQQEPESNIVMERVGDDVAFPLESAAVPPARIWSRVDAMLRIVGLDEERGVGPDRPTIRLSGGQQQLLAVGAACAADPALVLLDEPTANLDPESAAAVVGAVAAARAGSGSTVVVIEHRVEPWLALADRVLLSAHGTVSAHRPGDLPGLVASDPDLAGRVWLDHAHLPRRVPGDRPGAAVLEARGVTVPGRLPPTSLTVRAGEVVALTGPPGSGKSTLLSCLAGLLAPGHGTVLVRWAGGQDLDPWSWPAARIAEVFGIVFQDPEHQFLTGRVADELRHGLLGAGLPDTEVGARVDAMLRRLRLGALAQANPFTLSGGEQRRLSVGTALVRDPGILLLDEPTFGQDPATWAEVVDIIGAHRDAGGSVVLATHDPHLVTSLGARVLPLPGPGPTRAGPSRPGRQPVAAGRDSRTGTASGLRRLDPLVLVTAAALLSAAALISRSVGVNLGLAAVAVLAALLGGLAPRQVGLLAIPAGLAAASVALSNALLSQSGITSPLAWQAAALPATRVLAVALPGLVAAIALDPTALADSLVVRLRVPARAAYSVLAGLRLLPLLADEWAILGRASRARGIGGAGPAARARQFTSMAFRLLVAALRRAGRLAVALDVRGLRSGSDRTVARPVTAGWVDAAAMVGGVLALAGALATRL
jgi:energy-coupling factor transporter ATP-binding protein EcfA2/energy-coupling factor transporter transmembrane protein EcfT